MQDIILPLIRNSVSPLSESYLQACLDADESKIYLLRKLLEDEVVLTLKSAGDIKLNAYLECLAATLLASDPAIATKVQTMSTTSKSVEYLNASIKLLSIAAQNQLSSLFLLMLQFLQDYQNQHATHSDDQTNQAIGQEISTCRNLLVTITSAAATVPYPFELAHKLLNTLERTYDPISHRRNSLVRPTTFPSIPVEIEFLVQSTLLNNCQDAPSTFAGSLAARFAMHQAISADQNGDGAQVVLNAWYGDLFSYCSEHAPLLDEPKSRTGARKRAFVFGYLPGLLLGLRNDSRLSSTMLNWNTAVAAGMEKCKERSEQSGQGDLSELSQAMREFISDAEKPVRSAHVSMQTIANCKAACTNFGLLGRWFAHLA